MSALDIFALTASKRPTSFGVMIRMEAWLNYIIPW